MKVLQRYNLERLRGGIKKEGEKKTSLFERIDQQLNCFFIVVIKQP
jgi:hypothetical protein